MRQLTVGRPVSGPDESHPSARSRAIPLVLGAVGLVLLVWVATYLVAPASPHDARWLILLASLVPAVILVVAGVAVAAEPRPLTARRILAGIALLWVLFLFAAALLRFADGRFDATLAGMIVLAALDGGALLALAASTPEVTPEPLAGPIGRLGATVLFGAAILVAIGLLVVVALVAVALIDAIANAGYRPSFRWGLVVLIIALPIIAFGAASLGSRRAAGATFYAQQGANRRNSVLLLIALVGILAAVAEIITASLTLNATPTLVAAAVASIIGGLAALGADRRGAGVILLTAGAHRATGTLRERVLLDVVRELALAADIPEPDVYVIESPSPNAFATGRDPGHASLAVTAGLLERMDREQLQGVVGHEMAHIRNLDTRYALYVAMLVGLVALVTDGFLRAVLEGWDRGAFFWSSDDKSGLTVFVSGLIFGLFLLLVAGLLKLVAPFFSMLVQAASSREREFLADATSVELTRNPTGLERALVEIADDRTELRGANRGTQHLWFRNPMRAGSDRRSGILATHPSIGARVERLRALGGTAVPAGSMTALEDET
jgi:heat shock protein HtpX